MAKALKLPQESGAITADVLPGGPADQAGLKIDDIIVGVNGSEIKRARDLQSFIYGQALDNQVTMTVRRGDQTLSLKMKVIERADDPQRFADMVDPEKNIIPQLGVLVVEVDEKMKDHAAGIAPQLRAGDRGGELRFAVFRREPARWVMSFTR